MVSLRKRKQPVNYKITAASDIESSMASDEEERSVYSVALSADASDSTESSVDLEAVATEEEKSEEGSNNSDPEDESVVSVLSAGMPRLQPDISSVGSVADENPIDSKEAIERWNSWHLKLADLISKYFDFAYTLNPGKPSVAFYGERRGRKKGDNEIPLTTAYVELPQLSPSAPTEAEPPAEKASKGKKKGKKQEAKTADVVTGGFCPVPGCPKSKLPDNAYTAPSFKVYPSFKYHFTNHRHSLRDLLANLRRQESDGVAGVSQLCTDLDLLLKTENLPPYPPPPNPSPDEEWTILITGPVKFLWPGENEAKQCTFTWSLEDLFQAQQQLMFGDGEEAGASKKRVRTDAGDSAISREEALSLPVYEPRPYVAPAQPEAISTLSISDELLESRVIEIQPFVPSQYGADQKKLFVQTTYSAAKRSNPHTDAVTMDLFQSITQDEKLARKRGMMLNVGERPSAMKWLPTLEEKSNTFLAVTNSADHNIYVNGNPKSGLNLLEGCVKVQIWSVCGLEKGQTPAAKLAAMLNLVVSDLDHANQFIMAMDWYPVNESSKCIGVLVAVFGDGRLGVYAVPSIKHEEECREISLAPLCQFSSPSITFTSISAFFKTDQAPKLAAGTSTGEIAIWNMAAVVEQSEFDAEMIPPLHLYPAHSGAISSLCWQPFPTKQNDEIFIASGGYDGQIIISSTDQPWRCTNYPGQHDQIWNSRSFVLSLFWATDGIFFAGVDRIVRWVPVKRAKMGPNPSFMYDQLSSHSVMNSRAHVLTLSGSQYHGFIATGTAEGTLHISQARRFCGKGLTNVQITEFCMQSFEKATGKNDIQSTSESQESTGLELNSVEFDESLRTDSSTVPRTDTATPIHIYPQSFSATDVQWHPNPYLACDGWLAVSLEMGMIRIESVNRTELLDTKQSSSSAEPQQKEKQQRKK